MKIGVLLLIIGFFFDFFFLCACLFKIDWPTFFLGIFFPVLVDLSSIFDYYISWLVRVIGSSLNEDLFFVDDDVIAFF